MSDYNEKLPWILILGGCAILALRLIVALFSSLSVIDWLAIIIVFTGLIMLVLNSKSWKHLRFPKNSNSQNRENSMKNRFSKIFLTYIFIFAIFFSCTSNGEKNSDIEFKLADDTDSISYSIGADIGDNLINQGIDINYDAFNAGFRNGYEKEEHLLTMEKRRELFKSMQDRMRVKQQAEASKALEKAESFLKDNKDKNKDIQVTKSGLQYRVIKKGSGKSPDSSSDQVRVHYEGKLLDGTIFDSSYKKGEPFVTRLNRVIKGWTEGIQLMNEGSEYEFFIHPRLAYGARRNNDIPPNSVLIFKVELQKVFDKNLK